MPRQQQQSSVLRRVNISMRELQPRPLLPPQRERDRGKKTLILDLDETLIHSSFEPLANADWI